MVKITVDPVTRITSGLRFEVDMRDGSVVDARCSGTTYRGFEQMLAGRDPRDAVYFTQRVCGMCSAPQATAAAGALESLAGAAGAVPKDALVIRNILNGLTWLRSHVENLYLSFLPDLTDPFYGDMLRFTDTGAALLKELNGRFAAPGFAATAAAPGSAYADAVRCLKLISDTEAILAGRSPHGPAIVPGGVTARPTATDLNRLKANYSSILEFLQRRLTAPLTPAQWLDLTHAAGADPNYILDYLHTLPAKNLAAESGWNDMLLFTTFGSLMMSDLLALPAYIELDTIGGYPLLDPLIGYLNGGAFYRVRDDGKAFRDGYVPLDSKQAGSFVIPAGFTAGGMANLYSAADGVDPAQIGEQVSNSFYSYGSGRTSLPPANGETSPLAGRADIDYAGAKYSFVKAPRYGGVPCEVGPMARMINTREPFIFNIMKMLHDSNTGFLGGKSYSMTSVYTRALSRMQETLVVARLLGDWINEDLELHDDPRKYCAPVTIGSGGAGAGLIEAPRGLLGHWLRLDGNGRIANYQIVAPTSWNASPRDGEVKYGPMELASIGIKTTPRGNLPGSEANPLSLYHIVRSFDPCVACAVHTVRGRR
ncbi:MAG TPA: nickel-dependent hydrogenase large subunit [Methanocella sp.]|nr:nickel-dependent hydrogenase large subunit [Methanocella sp.]